MSIEIWTEAVATGLEIASFVFVTSDLFGRDNVERRAIALRDRTRDSFYNSFVSDDGSVWRNVLLVTVIILIAIAAIAYVIHVVHDESAMFAKSQTGRGHHPDWREFFMGIPPDAPWYDWRALLVFGLGAVVLLLIGGYLLYAIGIALYVVSVLIYFAIVKAIFWRDAPERGLLFFGASLFVHRNF